MIRHAWCCQTPRNWTNYLANSSAGSFGNEVWNVFTCLLDDTSHNTPRLGRAAMSSVCSFRSAWERKYLLQRTLQPGSNPVSSTRISSSLLELTSETCSYSYNASCRTLSVKFIALTWHVAYTTCMVSWNQLEWSWIGYLSTTGYLCICAYLYVAVQSTCILLHARWRADTVSPLSAQRKKIREFLTKTWSWCSEINYATFIDD